MSQENVEVVQASFTAYGAGDMIAWGGWLAPDVVSRPPEGWPEPGPFVGREAVLRQFEQQRDAFAADTVEFISDYFVALDRVAVRFIWHGTGHGPEANLEMTGVYTIRKGKILEMEFFWDHAEALETLGLSEQDAPAGS
jgi:ketosteroid isomerase-like protein